MGENAQSCVGDGYSWQVYLWESFRPLHSVYRYGKLRRVPEILWETWLLGILDRQNFVNMKFW